MRGEVPAKPLGQVGQSFGAPVRALFSLDTDDPYTVVLYVDGRQLWLDAEDLAAAAATKQWDRTYASGLSMRRIGPSWAVGYGPCRWTFPFEDLQRVLDQRRRLHMPAEAVVPDSLAGLLA